MSCSRVVSRVQPCCVGETSLFVKGLGVGGGRKCKGVAHRNKVWQHVNWATGARELKACVNDNWESYSSVWIMHLFKLPSLHINAGSIVLETPSQPHQSPGRLFVGHHVIVLQRPRTIT